MPKASKSVRISSERILRSINLLYDADSPQNLEHFQPTQKTNKLLEAVLALKGDRSFMVVAPYGSGKSLSAAVSLHIAENRAESESFLKQLSGDTDALSIPLRRFIQDRLRHQTQGLAIALHGYSPCFAESLKLAAVSALMRLQLKRQANKLAKLDCGSLDDFPEFLDRLADICQRKGLDRVLILWDEFGRHLESLVAEGRADTLQDLQVLAEYCARSHEPTFSFTVLLHQILSRYAHRLPQTAQNEWAKVEGRFSTFQYVDTSKEVYRLITEVKSCLHGQKSLNKPGDGPLKSIAESLQKEGPFSGEFSVNELVRLLRKAFPIEPVALYLLPRVSARVAQNERTMFTFLSEADATSPITPESIYDYFSDLMRSDVSIGGTSRGWLEAESAIHKCRGDRDSIKAIKTACLLGLGLGGERAHASRELLELALKGYTIRSNAARKTIKSLIERNLLLHRRHTDSVSVWHGTDYDLRGRLEELMDLRGADFDWISFLRTNMPPQAWRAVRYYSEFGVKRYFSATYASLADLDANSQLCCLDEDGRPLDGRIIHVLIQSAAEVAQAVRLVKELQKNLSPRIVFSIPVEKSDLSRAALEVACLKELLKDDQLTSKDPMVPAELDEMIAGAEDYLSKSLNRATGPRGAAPDGPGPSWYSVGKAKDITSPRDLKELITELLKAEFSATPKIKNELIIKNTLSKPIANARRKLMTGILNQSGEPMFGLPETENRRPQASMCRTVLCNTGLYYKSTKGFRFASRHKTLPDPGLTKVWMALADFYADSVPKGKEPNRKSFFNLVNKLINVPYGVRSGVLPLLLCAGYEALGQEVLIFEKGEFVNQVSSTTFEDICRRPGSFTLRVVKLTSSQRKYLRQLIHLFQSEADKSEEVPSEVATPDELTGNLLASAYTTIEDWMSSLPIAVFSAQSVTEEAKNLQKILEEMADPEVTFLESIPNCFSKTAALTKVPERLAQVISELTSLTTEFQSEAARHMRTSIALKGPFNENNGFLGEVHSWASWFPKTMRSNGSNLIGRRLLDLASATYSCEGEFLDEIAVLLVGRPIIQWDSATLARFKDRLDMVIAKLERNLIDLNPEELDRRNEIPGVQRILQGRVTSLEQKLATLAEVKE